MATPSNKKQSKQPAGRGPRSASDGERTNRASDARELMGRRAPQSDPASDSLYGVVSVLYHALQGNDTSQQYGRDAQSEGDGELAQFFDECREQYDMLATRAKRILAGRLEGEAERGVISDEDEDEDEDEEASQDEG